MAILGLGGRGHLGVQFAARMGFETISISRGEEKRAIGQELGARHTIDSAAQDAAAELTRLGGSRVILATVTSGEAMESVLGGLGADGKLIVLGAAHDPLPVAEPQLVGQRRSIAGWPSGNSIDSEDTMRFAVLTGVRSRSDVFPLERASDGYDRMMSGKARFPCGAGESVTPSRGHRTVQKTENG